MSIQLLLPTFWKERWDYFLPLHPSLDPDPPTRVPRIVSQSQKDEMAPFFPAILPCNKCNVSCPFVTGSIAPLPL